MFRRSGTWRKIMCMLCVLSMCSLTAFAQKRVSGTVTDANGEPLAGASVMEKGTTNGNMTDLDGKFTLSGLANNAVLQVAFVGFVTQDVPVGNASTLNIVLTEDTQALEEVVVIGYGTGKKTDLVSAVSSVSPKQFAAEPITRGLGQILQGRVPGVQAMYGSGAVGSGPGILIRGATSLNKGTGPLTVVDGFYGANYSVQDIASIEILKDAASTAIYGSRGANGVILITTKKGQSGKPKVEFSTSQGFSNLAKRFDVMGAYEYALALNDIRGPGTISDADVAKYKSGELGVDWQDLMTQTGHHQEYYLNISGGSSFSRYLISSRIIDATGITLASRNRNYQVRLNMDNDITKWLHLNTNVVLSRGYSSRTSISFEDVALFSPTMEVKDPATGKNNRDPYNSINHSPMEHVDGENESYAHNVRGNAALRVDILDGLTLSIQGGVSYDNNLGYSFTTTKRDVNVVSTMANSTSNNWSWENTNILEYKKNFGDHALTATAVWELTSGNSRSMNISGNDLTTETVGYWNVGLAATRTAGNGYSESSMASALGRVQYSYQGKYLASASYRADGSSHFLGKNKWGYFPTAGIGWNIGEEEFMKDQELIQKLKLRANAGLIGNQGIDSYETLARMSGITHYFGTSNPYTGYWVATAATPNLQWEKTRAYDVGVELSLLNRRLDVEFDLWLKDTDDLLNRKVIPNYVGGGSVWVNQGRVKNKGVDFMVTAVPVETKDFSWESSLTGTYVENRVVDLAGEEEIQGGTIGGGLIGSASTIMKVGRSRNSFYVFDWAGIDEQTGKN
ncbi:MAG: SusC/RagA family TonB-linked outer membrane protein, partial [Tannerella sp.]|nr:SusC/RagA family TonB-linked outer membrane protein [Tannerella sp.]